MGGVSLRRALQSSGMLAGFEELDGPAMSEVGRVFLAHVGVAAPQGLQMGGAQHKTGRQPRKSLGLSLLVLGNRVLHGGQNYL